MFIKPFSIWVKLAPKPSSLPFHQVEFPTTMKVNNVSYEEADKRVRDLQGQRQKWVCFMIWTIRTFFISWGINIAIYCLLRELFWNSSEKRDCCWGNTVRKLENISFHVCHRIIHFPHILIINICTHISTWNTEAFVGTVVQNTFFKCWIKQVYLIFKWYLSTTSRFHS